MVKNYTEKDLIRFIYKETSLRERMEIQEQINKDWSLREEYQLLLTAYKELPKVTFSPSKKAIQKILNFSKGYKMEWC